MYTLLTYELLRQKMVNKGFLSLKGISCLFLKSFEIIYLQYFVSIVLNTEMIEFFTKKRMLLAVFSLIL